MTIKLWSVLAFATMLAVSACDAGDSKTAAAAKPAASQISEADAKAAAKKAETEAREKARAEQEALMKLMPSPGAFETACASQKVEAAICSCLSKATVDGLGPSALYSWVWEAFVERSAPAITRATRFKNDNAIPDAKWSAFEKKVNACYTH